MKDKFVNIFATRRNRFIIFLMIVSIIITVWAGYLRYVKGMQWANWTGFGEYTITKVANETKVIDGKTTNTQTTTVETVPAKTLWDFYVLILSVVVGISLAVFNQKNEERRKETEIEIATGRNQESNLQNYFDKMSELLLKESLRKPEEDLEVTVIARARTLSTLRTLDEWRKYQLLEFLYEAELINVGEAIVNLNNADLSDVNLSGVILNKADLSGANLYRADLGEADLSEADLSGALLIGADLSEANLSNANLSNAVLSNAVLSEADQSKALLSGADLSGADLSDADLSMAIVTREQLVQAKSLQGATMPDGTKHD